MGTESHRAFALNANKAIIIVFICTMGLLICCAGGSFAASAKDKKQPIVKPSPAQTPGKTAPLPIGSPPSLHEKEGLPEIRRDLAVQDLIVTPNEFSLGDRINVLFDIHNLGQTHISQVSYEVSILPLQMLFSGTINNIAPNSITGIKREVTIPQSLNPGRANIKAKIWLDDDNKENNSDSQFVTIHQELPNLLVEPSSVVIRTQPGPLQAGSIFEVKFRIRNTGQLESSPCKYKVTTERFSLFYGWHVIDERSYDIPRLGRSEFIEVSPRFQIPEDLPAGADLRITIYVDSMNQIREISERDNKGTLKVHY